MENQDAIRMIEDLRTRSRVTFTFEDIVINTKDRREQTLPSMDRSILMPLSPVDENYRFFYSFVFFLSTYWDPRKIPNPNVVYVPPLTEHSNIMEALSNLFPQVTWTQIDIDVPMEEAEKLSSMNKGRILFYSIVSPSIDDYEQDNLRLMSSQYELYLKLSPVMGAMRVKFPLGDSFYQYLAGTLFYMPFDRDPTHEFLLVGIGNEKMKFPLDRIYNQSSYFNQVVKHNKRFGANWELRTVSPEGPKGIEGPKGTEGHKGTEGIEGTVSPGSIQSPLSSKGTVSPKGIEGTEGIEGEIIDEIKLGDIVDWDMASQGFIISRYLQKYSKDEELSTGINVGKLIAYIGTI